MSEFPRASNRKRGRPKGSLDKSTIVLREALLELTERYERMTVRGCFYQMSSRGIVAKTELGYAKVQRNLLTMRREGLLPWAFIADGTRWMRRARTYDGVQDALAQMHALYRRDLWAKQDYRVEIWLEKDAMADVIQPVASEWGVPLAVTRGVSSETFVYNAADDASCDLRTTIIYTLFDFDAGGDRGHRKIEKGFADYCSADFIIERLAVTPEQIRDWELPTRPAKSTDPEAATWGGKPCVELDAIPPDLVTELVEDAIMELIDARAWEVEQAIEAEEKAGLLRLGEVA